MTVAPNRLAILSPAVCLACSIALTTRRYARSELEDRRAALEALDR
jgi:hypothetical protein